MPMPMPPTPPQMAPSGMGNYSPGASPAPQQAAPQAAQDPSQQQQVDPKTILALVFKKITDLMEAVNTQFPGGEDKLGEGLQSIGMGFQEKISRMGVPQEPPGPQLPA